MNGIEFWKKTICFCLCLILLDFVVGSTLSYFYFTQKKGKLYNITVALEKQDCEALIFGSSRAMHQYNPQIITDSLNYTCYNAGNDGQGILYANAVLDVILKRYTPQLIILDMLPWEFTKDEKSYDLLSALGPYVKRHPELWKTVSLRSKSEKIKYYSSIYPYNSMALRILSGNIPGKSKDTSDNGFTSQSGIWQDTIANKTFHPTDLDPNKVNAFMLFCSKCIEYDIDLYVAISPMYWQVKNPSNTISEINKICAEKGIHVIDYTNDKNYTDNNLFMDPDHLNAIGADVFTRDISHKIALSSILN